VTQPVSNIAHLHHAALGQLAPDAAAYLESGADDNRTLAANTNDWANVHIRCRRLVNVSTIDLRCTVLDATVPSPIALSPVGFQSLFHKDAELATAKGAEANGHLMIASSLGTQPFGTIAKHTTTPLWFQLYPTTNRAVTKTLLDRAHAAHCKTVVLTVDVPRPGNREAHLDLLESMNAGSVPLGNYEGIRTSESIFDPSMTWDIVQWLREHTSMNIVLKGIVTHEDAKLCIEHGVDGIIVSNHGGRQEESDRSTVACLPEVAKAVDARIPIMIDGGIRRGTDVFKALALGANMVCIGRPYIWGLAAHGAAGVAQALSILDGELERAMQLAGTPRVQDITQSSVGRNP
jgi:(S)-2-hydroxy-acid oxidase